MSIKAGLVGLPNVGKSTLFNALTKSSIPAENYPFCTIDPHVAITQVPDTRPSALQKIYASKKIIPTTVTFVDIAGLVKGAASGQGLGNNFLSHIKEVDLILHVVRCFQDSEVTREEKIDPLQDHTVIMTELMLKDLEAINKRLVKVAHQIKAHQSKPKEKAVFEAEKQFLEKIQPLLDNENYTEAKKEFSSFEGEKIPLLSIKKSLIIANVSENELENNQFTTNPHYQNLVSEFGSDRVIPVSAKAEYELSQMSADDASEMMNLIGLEKQALPEIIKKTYTNLGFITFFTCGPQEIHAWQIPQNMNVRAAGGQIHSDLERGFICAEVFNCNDLFTHKTISALKSLGKVRMEGADYQVQDGDIILIKFNI